MVVAGRVEIAAIRLEKPEGRAGVSTCGAEGRQPWVLRGLHVG